MILLYTLKSVAFALTEPYLVLLLAILAFTLYRKNKQTVIMQQMIIGEKINSPFELTISQIVIGIFGGILVSVIMSYLGVIFDENSAIDLIFLASIIFMFFNPRFICFSYSGAILGFISIILSVLSQELNIASLNFLKIDVVSLMSMVAILHLVEGILIIIDGKRGAIPVFTSKDGNIIGGFALQRYWAIPMAIIFMLHPKSMVGNFSQISVQDWWPLVNSAIPRGILQNAVMVLIPFYAVMGYNSVTFTRDVKQKTAMSGGLVILYSLALFGIAQAAVFNIWLKFLVLVFAPLAHEGIMLIQRNLEMKGKPKYISSNEGIMVLAVAPNSPANEMGIKSGDLLVEINSEKIESEDRIMEIIKECSNFIWFKVKRVAGNFEQVSYNRMNKNKRLGIVFVPRNVPKNSMVVKLDKNRFSEILNKIKNKDKDD